jgi:hypothetical protein
MRVKVKETKMEKVRIKKPYQKPSWRKQEVVENFAMQASCKTPPVCKNIKS